MYSGLDRRQKKDMQNKNNNNKVYFTNMGFVDC